MAVAGVDLDVYDGEFFSMLGPSGSGKTTTLRMIAGFELPSEGRILLHGTDVTTVPPFDRDVNTVFQDYALFPHLSVGDNVGYGLVVRKVGKDERRTRVAEALRMVRLEGYESRKPSQLSGGQRQRVALARALVNRPRVLLLDEPLGALDLKLREEMQIELKAIQQQVGITFIYVTHDQEEALTMSDRLAVFNKGRIEQLGSPAEVYERPATRFVAGFVGTSNLLRGEVAASILGEAGTFTIRPEKIRLAEPGCRRRGRRGVRAGRHPRGRLPRPGHPVPRRARRGRRPRGHPAEPGDVLDRGARAAGQGCPPRLEATASAPRRGRRVNLEEEIRMRIRGIAALAATAALVVGACSSGGTSGGSPAASAAAPHRAASAAASAAGSAPRARAERRRRPSAKARARSTSSRGPATSSAGPAASRSRATTGSRRSRRRPAARSTVKVGLDSANMVQLMKTGQYDGVSASGDATLRLIAGGDVAPVDFA